MKVCKHFVGKSNVALIHQVIFETKNYFIIISLLKFTNLFEQFSITLSETFGRYVVLLQCLQNFDRGWNGPKGGLMTC